MSQTLQRVSFESITAYEAQQCPAEELKHQPFGATKNLSVSASNIVLNQTRETFLIERSLNFGCCTDVSRGMIITATNHKQALGFNGFEIGSLTTT